MLQFFICLYSLTPYNKAASLADSSPATVPLPLRVEPKTKTGIRQQDLLKNVVEVKPKRQKVSTQAAAASTDDKNPPTLENNPIKSLLAAYASSDDDED
ncbi:hypothetical protein HanHA300_Chr04g0155471 [Helianthus annuus]|nr:hypothetical protein HanHA300_Chr04g0155471 [Helianthus annuus]